MKLIVTTIISILLMTSFVSAEVIFNEDLEKGEYAFFWYTLQEGLQNWLINQPSITDLLIHDEGYTQVWITGMWEDFQELQQKIKNMDWKNEQNTKNIALLPQGYNLGDCKRGDDGLIYNCRIRTSGDYVCELDNEERCIE